MINADAFLQYGAIGLLALLCVVAVRVLFQQVKEDKDRETARADRNEASLLEQNKSMMKDVLPAVMTMIQASQEMNRMVEELARLMAVERDRRRRDESER